MQNSIFTFFFILMSLHLSHAQVENEGPKPFPRTNPAPTPGPIPDFPSSPFPHNGGPNSGNSVGRVIETGRGIVALGEAVYNLVIKGKPTNTTSYAPVNVVPNDPRTGQPIDPFEIEYSSKPEIRNYVIDFKNSWGLVVAKFEYQVIYSYGGCYNGRGHYLTNVMIVPKKISTPYARDFNASMKIAAVYNEGSKDDPIAGVMLTLKYQFNSLTSAREHNDTISINGYGEIKNYALAK